MRFIFFFRADVSVDITWFAIDLWTWTTIEPGMYLIAAALPSLRPLLGLIFQNVDFSTLGSRLLHHRTKESLKKTKTRDMALSGRSDSSAPTQGERIGFRQLVDKKDETGFSSLDDSKRLVACYREDDRGSHRPLDLESEISGNGILVQKDFGFSSSLR